MKYFFIDICAIEVTKVMEPGVKEPAPLFEKCTFLTGGGGVLGGVVYLAHIIHIRSFGCRGGS